MSGGSCLNPSHFLPTSLPYPIAAGPKEHTMPFNIRFLYAGFIGGPLFRIWFFIPTQVSYSAAADHRSCNP